MHKSSSAIACSNLYRSNQAETRKLIDTLREVDETVALAEYAVFAVPATRREAALDVFNKLAAARDALFRAVEILVTRSPYQLDPFFHPSLAEYLKVRSNHEALTPDNPR
jgi:hypothetical protein